MRSHTTHSQGTFLNYFPLKHRFDNAIIVGNGHIISVHGHGHVSLPSPNEPLTLKNILHAPKLMIIWSLLNLIISDFM